MDPSEQNMSKEPSRVSKRFSKAGAAEDRLLLELSRKYRILAQLGEGGTARVWLAMARGPSGFNKLVVLKTVRGELFDNASVVEMFLEEARLAARLNHPHIVQTNEVFEQAQHPVIVMEYLDGLPFSAILERQREGNALALAMLLRILSDALSGLHAAHELEDYDGTPLNVVHRDVSPHNLFVTFAGQAKVLDFGIAQFNTSIGAAEPGVLKGKLRYIAPEQVQGEAPVDRRADIYSMGVVLWEVATAQRMWANVPEPTIMKRLLAGDLPKAQDVGSAVDGDLQRIISRALSLNPEDRYPTALEFQTDLDQYLATLGGALRDRDIGRALSKMFDDVREERRLTIEQQLARSDTLHDIQLNEAPLPELTSFSNIQALRPMRSYRLRPGPQFLILLALLAMSLFGVTLFWPLAKEGANAKSQPSLLPSAPLALSAARAKVETISLRISALPVRASLKLDGAVLPSNPYAAELPRDESRGHPLLVEAEGHLSEHRTLIFSRDQELVLTLQPEPVPENVGRDRPPSTPPKMDRSAVNQPARLAPVVETLKQSCAVPFFYDERGIKKYRAECL